jgi:uncharacterized C2H2 Zn-finger protein
LGQTRRDLKRNLSRDEEIFFEGNRKSAIFKKKKDREIQIKSLKIKEMNPKLQVNRLK